jgi:ATP-binding cassette subfamily C (CFTR/MRP) protein 4
VYVLDDPLSAVDAHVGRALMADCIIGTLKKGNKATILVTHQLQYLEFADKILVLDIDGNQTFYGSYSLLQSTPAVLSSLDMIVDSLNAQSAGTSPAVTLRKTRGESADKGASPQVTQRKGARSESLGSEVSVGAVDDVPPKVHSKYDPDFRAKARAAQQLAELERQKDTETSPAEETARGEGETAMEQQRRKIVQVEDREMGNMSLSVYWRYIRSGGTCRGVLALFVIFLSQAVIMMTEYWMRWWATDAFGDQRDIKYILIFAGLVVLCVWIGFYRALGWFAFTLVAASDLQERCLWAVMHSPMTFFVSNPTGRVLNRFSRDQNQVDELLPATIFSFLETAIYCTASVILICITIPWMALLVPFLILFFVKFRTKYITSTREIKRIEAVTRSPIYADFSATLEGLTTLRAYQLETRVASLFQEQVDDNARVFFSFLMCARWLGLRLDLETAVILTFVCFLAVILRDTVDVGLLGFALVYTMSLSGLFQWTVRQSVEVETQMTSVERINTYAQLPPEEGYATTLEQALHSPSTASKLPETAAAHHHKYEKVETAAESKPSKAEGERRGHLVLKDLTVTYRRDLDPVLRHIDLDIPAGYKVGICGRTGSGKSSSLLALLRLNIITSGDILLDGKSLLAMDLQSARSHLSIIPQEPHLFSGTVRFNLDPFSMHTDAQIWAALEDAHIMEHIKQDPLGLSAQVEESGKNFSVGQRQLLSLARAILRESKVVLMDEVTASIDYLTDRLIQETIRTSPALRDSTIITVAHRLRTIADSDLIVVVHAGEVVEMGAPGALLLASKGKADTTSHFTKLVQESNEYDEIFRIATTKLKL